jgi:hypothetical protein
MVTDHFFLFWLVFRLLSKRKASSKNVAYNILHFKFVNILGAEGSLSNVDVTSDMSVDEEECTFNFVVNSIHIDYTRKRRRCNKSKARNYFGQFELLQFSLLLLNKCGKKIK